MPIRRTFRRLWTLVTRREALHHRPAGAPEEARAYPPAAPPPARPRAAERPLTAGSVELRVWSVGPYVIVAGTAAEAAHALERFGAERDPRWRDEARRLHATLRTGGVSEDVLRVAV
jgi:hypothetical protein